MKVKEIKRGRKRLDQHERELKKQKKEGIRMTQDDYFTKQKKEKAENIFLSQGMINNYNRKVLSVIGEENEYELYKNRSMVSQRMESHD